MKATRPQQKREMALNGLSHELTAQRKVTESRLYVKEAHLLLLKCWPERQASNLTHIYGSAGIPLED